MPAFSIDINNSGGTGLFYIPTAITLQEGQIVGGIGIAYPHNIAYTSLGFINPLELSLKLTDVVNYYPSSSDPSAGTLKDKSVDFKYRLLPEMGRLPAVAVGAQDLLGTRAFGSYFAVATKQMGDLDLTIGYGLAGLAGWFGGWKIKIPPLLHCEEVAFIYEANSSGLKTAPSGFYPREQILGLRFKPLQEIQIDLAIDDKNQIIANGAVSFPLDWHLFSWSEDAYFNAEVEARNFSQLDSAKVIERIFNYAREEGYFNLAADLTPQHLYLEYENGDYYSDIKALGRIMRIGFGCAPQDVNWAYFVPKIRNLRALIIKANKQKYFEYVYGKISDRQFADSLIFFDVAQFRSDPAYRKPTARQYFYRSIGLMPGLENQFVASSDFYKYRLAVDIWGYSELWNGANAYGTIKAPFSNSINAPYKNLSTRLYYGLVSQMLNFGGGWYASADIGYLTEYFTGVDVELLKTFSDDRLGVGVNSSNVYLRDEYSFVATEMSQGYQNLFGTLYLKVPELNFDARLKAGRFVYGDDGARLEITKYFNETKIGFWYTRTNYGDIYLSGEYDSKGIIISVPMNIFYKNDSKETFYTSFTPWGTYVGHMVSPYGSTLANTIQTINVIDIKSGIAKIKE